MDKNVTLKFGESSLGQEFPVTLSIAYPDMLPHAEVSASLPSDPELYQLYATWATAYRQLGLSSQENVTDAIERSIIDLETCRNSARLLNDRLNFWLQAAPFHPVSTALMDGLEPSDNISILIQTTNIWLKRLPWHLWELGRAFPGIDIGLMAPPTPSAPAKRTTSPTVRVLTVLSHDDEIDRTERSISSSNLDLHLLIAPSVNQFYESLTGRSWDIIFLSRQQPNQMVGETGRFYFNSFDSLGMEELSPIINGAALNGVQMLMVNSWDGMAIAPALEATGIPHVITMREPAPTRAAYHFFHSFLDGFSSGQSFYRSIRQGRQALERLDADIPCASWLPVVSQQPTVDAPRWEDWTHSGVDQTLPPLPDLLTGDSLMPPPSGSNAMSLSSQPTDISYSSQLRSANHSDEQASIPSESDADVSASQHSRNLIHHRYQIRKVLGRGGFGRTYLAIDTHRFDEQCVLKQFIPASRSEASLRKARELFQREAKVLYQIDHPQIPKFLAWFTHEEDLFIVQEYVDGQSYLDLMRDRRFKTQKTFSEQEIIQWLFDLVPVLDYIHSIGIVHRDISPANVMFSNAKQKPMLIDFGVVKEVVNQILSGQYSTFARPPKATLVGKPGYSPPEQLQLGDCFPCSDFYSLGMTALVLLTGKDARTSRYDWRHDAAVSDGLACIIERMLAERPRERYQAAQAIMVDLQRLVDDHRSPPAAAVAPSTQRRSPASPSIPTIPSIPSIEQLPEDLGVVTNVTEWEHFQTPELSAQFLAQCQQALSEYIGPVASFAIEDILSQASTLDSQEFLSLLADEIPDTAAAAEFQQHVHQKIQHTNTPPAANSAYATRTESEPQANSLHQGRHRSPQSSGQHNQPQAQLIEPLSSTFITRCRHELARCIGPMAQFVVDDALEVSDGLTESQFIEAIAAEIPNPQMADTFRQRVKD
ncbi:MAG: serine/threonine-protein kinase [Cyanobacteria bacterium J06626_14]